MSDSGIDIGEIVGADQLAALFSQLKLAIDSGNPAEIQAATEATELALQDADVTDTEVQEALQKVAVDPNAAGDGYDAHPDHSPEGTVDYLKTLIQDNQLTEVDQSVHGGEVHGNLETHSESNVANATGEGSIAGNEVYDNQTQTGDGQQVGGDSGVQNQGDNSGQQAGYDADADNVTSGDNNEVASGWSSGVGDNHTTLDHVDANDSALAFGDGDSTTNAADTLTETVDIDTTFDTNDSGNFYATDDDTQTNIAEIRGEDYEGYEPGSEHEHEHDYDGDGFGGDIDVDQHNVIADVEEGFLE